MAYSWPGNLREIRNAIKRFVLLSQGDVIDTDVFPTEIIYPEMPEAGIETSVDDGPKTLKEVAQMAEKRAIIKTLQQTNNNKSKAAALLDVDRKTLYNKMSEYGINL